MPDLDHLQSELEAFEIMTAGFVGSVLRAARSIPEDKWNWSISERTPTPREVVEHTFMWLWCDRQQMTILDRSLHRPTPDLPPGKEAMIEMLRAEGEEWREMVRALNPDDLLETRATFGGDSRNLRSFLFHMGQHVIYKAGQIWLLAFELGLDGAGPYTAPHPNEDYGFEGPAWPSPRK